LSVGGRGSETWLRGIVTDAQEVIENEVWTVTVRSWPDVEPKGIVISSFYVLAPTCEVIGRSDTTPKSPSGVGQLSPSPGLRVDWSAYIHSCCGVNVTASSNGASLLQHLKWADYEEYDRGISKLWLRRIAKDGETGVAKRLVAERYVLACVVANRYGFSGRLCPLPSTISKLFCFAFSISGIRMSTVEMAQEFASLPQRRTIASTKVGVRDTRLHLFLPA
jgi:hypothetical protein